MKVVFRLFVIAIFLLLLFFAIAYARGYRFDMKKGVLSSTGILAVTSNPKAAKIYVNSELKGATDSNLSLPPGIYSVEIKKDGYTGWIKKVNLKGELVISLDALLFPLNPSLSPLTNLGIVKASPLDQTDKILVFADSNDVTKDGIYLFDAGKKPISLLSPLKRIILKKNFHQAFDLTSSTTYFSPDFKQVIVEFQVDIIHSFAYLLSLEEENLTAFDITKSKATLLEAWNKEQDTANLKVLETYPKEIAKIATDSFHIISFSPNDTKMFYQVKEPISLPLGITPPLIATNQTKEERSLKKDHLYVYDMKEDRNYEISAPVSRVQPPDFIQWYPDSKHLSFNDNKKIVVIDYDGTNKQSVYSGPFDESFFTITGDGSLITLSNLNPETNKLPDLYAVGIK